MKKFAAILLTAGILLSFTGCGGTEMPETEPTLPLPLWAQDEDQRPAVPELTEAAATGPLLPDQNPEETAPAETVSQIPALETTEQETTEALTEPTEPSATEAAVIQSEYQMEPKFKPVKPETVYAVKMVNIRMQGNVHSIALAKLYEGKTVTRIGISDDGWSAVLYEDQVCYISSNYLSTEEHPEAPDNPNVPNEQTVDDMVYTIDDVNMREGPGFDRAVLCRVPEYVDLHRTGIVTSGWCRVTYKDQEGFIATHYLAEKHPGESESEIVQEEAVDDVVYTTREVNFRKTPGTDKTIIGRIPQGTELKRTAISQEGWGKVTYDGKTGYVSGDFLSKEMPAEG